MNKQSIKIDINSKLRIESSKSCSGKINNFTKIPTLKENNYYIIDQLLDGDAPKQFIAAYFYKKENDFFKKNRKSWSKYIAKTAEKWYPHESIIEYIINKCGEILELNINETELVVCNNQIRFLSKYFLNSNETLVHGAEICGDYLNDRELAKEIAEDKNSARELFTFEFICESLDKLFKKHSEELKIQFVKMLVFDCLIGNNDRHFYNWGVITHAYKKVKKPKFAPIYDTARGLLWNMSDEKIIEMNKKLSVKGNKLLENYLLKSYPRISLENNKNANHFQLIEYIVKESENYRALVLSMSSHQQEEKLVTLHNTFFKDFFIKDRNILIEAVIRQRFNKTRSLVE